MKLRNRYKFVILGAISLCVGLVVYLIFRPNTYISEIIASFLNISFKYLDVSSYRIVRFYVGDYLWAVSLSLWLHAIFLPRTVGSILCTVTVSTIGLTYEILQFFGIVIGTGDGVDFLMYLLAGLTVNIINKNFQRRKNK